MTTVNLRRAAALIQSVDDLIKTTHQLLTQMISVDIHSDLESSVSSALEKTDTVIRDTETLVDLLYRLRARVGRANAEVGVSDHLAKIASLDRKIRFYQMYQGAQPAQQIHYLQTRLNKMSEAYGTPGVADYVQVSTFSESTVQKIKDGVTAAKKEKQKLNDLILELNIQTKIDLEDQDVVLLTKYGLL